ncbi:MAG: chemotaxis response regulator protein-glutamate methylesterase [Spirochaetaceae bacterium]|jgi:two-component system chemotaxis response regulator CheB|nr:chemotaxis response regulator protein-glutamate methylesterase [Spirochaetaceae bacterium]
MERPVTVLIVDDSALMRSLVSRIVESTPGLAVADKAMNGQFALDKIASRDPDVIVLDVEMPVMNGIEFLKERKKRGIEIPVIMLSSLTKNGARITMECLDLGASDFVAKPSGSESPDIGAIAPVLGNLLLVYGRKYQNKPGRKIRNDSDISAYRSTAVPAYKTAPEAAFPPEKSRDPQQHGSVVPLRSPGPLEVIAIGISTGGPNALRDVFKDIDPGLSQPILVVQHMPAGFTDEFARSLNNICPLEVKEAADGDLLKSGRVLIAPGNFHILVEQRALGTIVRVSDAPPRNGHRPSADVLFESVATVFQNRALGIIMTGMGKDGAAMLAELRRQGSRTLGQDEKTSIVYGMPKVAFEMGGVEKQVSLSEMAKTINTMGREFR